MINLRWPKSRIRYASNCYILSSCGECAIIDPTVPYSPDLLDGELKYIILTHCHFDHILEIDSWKNNTNAVVLVSAEDGKALSDPDVNCYRFFFGENKGYFGDYLQFKDGDAFALGDEMIRVISCPGHTKGSVALMLNGLCFVGDTVFAGGGFGRFDLPGGDHSELIRSIDKITSLEENTVLYCGHGPETTVREYKKYFRNK